jgi:hypothetical protein
VEQNIAAAAHRPPRSRSVPLIRVVCRSFPVSEIARSQNAEEKTSIFFFHACDPIRSPGLLLKQEGKIFHPVLVRFDVSVKVMSY